MHLTGRKQLVTPKQIPPRWELVEESLHAEDKREDASVSQYNRQILGMLRRLAAVWLLLFLLTYQFAVVGAGLPDLSPTSVVMRAAGASGQRYLITVWSEKRLLKDTGDPQLVQQATQSLAEKVGLRNGKGLVCSQVDQVWVCYLSGHSGRRRFEVLSTWDPQADPGERNQLTILRVAGVVSEQLPELQQRYTHLVSALTGVRAQSMLEVTGVTAPGLKPLSLSERLQQAFSRHRFWPVRLTVGAAGVKDSSSPQGRILEGTAQAPGARHLTVVAQQTSHDLLTVHARLEPAEGVPKKVETITYTGNKWTEYN